MHVTSRCQGLFPPHPFFKGKALGTRLIIGDELLYRQISPGNFRTVTSLHFLAVFWLWLKSRLQNSPQFCLFKYARAVAEQKVWNEAENKERETRLTRLARFARVRLLRHASPISLLILRKKPTVLESS